MDRLQHAGAFVVQFRAESLSAGLQKTGRIEHVASGRITVFGSLPELLTVLDQMLTDVGTQLQTAERDTSSRSNGVKASTRREKK
jgi:hypothetical protein